MHKLNFKIESKSTPLSNAIINKKRDWIGNTIKKRFLNVSKNVKQLVITYSYFGTISIRNKTHKILKIQKHQ